MKNRAYDLLSFDGWFDTFAVWSPSDGWLSYLNNRADIGIVSAFAADAMMTLDGFSSDVLLDLGDLQNPQSWFYTDIDPAFLASHYAFSEG
jgi:hypothetical protein